MSLIDFRMAVGIRYAEQIRPKFGKITGSNLAAKDGLRYERKVYKQLMQHLGEDRFLRIEHGPWFEFTDTYGTAQCSPDFLIYTETQLIIVECKLTWVEHAIHKLNDLYNPVVSVALGQAVYPLLICRNLTRGSPPAEHSLSAALASPYRLLHWPEIGEIRW